MLPAEIKGKRIVYTVLNWGLGHAARSIPLIRQLMSQGNDVHLASDGHALLLLKKELPDCFVHELPALNIHYEHASMTLNLLTQLPQLAKHHLLDKKAINTLTQTLAPDIMIADHRYGSFHNDIHSVFLGHQLSILSPRLKAHIIATRTNAKLINAFDEVWVPDTKDQRLSGILSSNPHITKPIHFIGPLSRFKKAIPGEKKYDTLCVLSGPEPARTRLESDLLHRLGKLKGQHVIVRGTTETIASPAKNVDIISMATTKELQKLFNLSHRFIGRAGYSTIMDLDCLGLPAELIPTPGQTEQEYLENRHCHK